MTIPMTYYEINVAKYLDTARITWEKRVNRNMYGMEQRNSKYVHFVGTFTVFVPN